MECLSSSQILLSTVGRPKIGHNGLQPCVVGLYGASTVLTLYCLIKDTKLFITSFAQLRETAVISMCAPHSTTPCFYEACLPVIKIQMDFTRVVGSLFGGYVEGKDFFVFSSVGILHTVRYTQAGGKFASLCGAKINIYH
jgi:hypothetical protein